MFNAIVLVEFFQIKSIVGVAFLKHPRGEVWHKRAEGRTEVVSCPDVVVKVDKRDISTVARDDTCDVITQWTAGNHQNVDCPEVCSTAHHDWPSH